MSYFGICGCYAAPAVSGQEEGGTFLLQRLCALCFIFNLVLLLHFLIRQKSSHYCPFHKPDHKLSMVSVQLLVLEVHRITG